MRQSQWLFLMLMGIIDSIHALAIAYVFNKSIMAPSMNIKMEKVNMPGMQLEKALT
jgi:hypothetical protein